MLDLVNVEYDTLIPNNVGLSSDKRVQKALEKWHPGYINWWNDLIPRLKPRKQCVPNQSPQKDCRGL